MTRKQITMSFNSSCLRVPINPYSQQPSPSYERGLVATPNTEDEGSCSRKFRVGSASSRSRPSRPASRMNSPASKRSAMSKSTGGKTPAESSNNSPLDSFMDFYESIPDYQDVTHLSDKEFADRMKLLRHKQREYLHNMDGRYSTREFECEGANSDYQKKTCKRVNKLELAKEWLNKSCDSLSSLGRKSENEYRMRNLEIDNQSKKAPSANVSPRKYVQYDLKNDPEANIIDSGSSLSTDSHMLKSKVLTPTFVMEEQREESNQIIEDCGSPFTSTGRSESCQGISTLLRVKESSSNNYDFYNLKESMTESHPSTAKKTSHQSCALRSSETSELNVQDCNSHYGLNHHDVLTYEDYYVPSSGWMQSDSDSILGTMHHVPSTRPSTAILSQSLPGSPISKRSNSTKTSSLKKKTRRKRRGPQKTVAKPAPFNFVSSERQYTRSTPDLSSHYRSPSPKHFRARPIPRNLFSNYVYQKKQDDEFFRALKRKVRAEEMLRAASLPPSMEFRERLGRVQAEAEAASLGPSSSSDHSGGPGGGGGGGGGGGAGGGAADANVCTGTARGRPGRSGRARRARRTPDLSKGHGHGLGHDHDHGQAAASPSPYSLRATSLSPRRKQGSLSSGSDSRRCRPRSSGAEHVPVSTSRSNLAAVLRVQAARQRLEAEHHRLREEQARRAEARLKERLTRLTPAWRSIQYSTEEDLALRAAARREEERQRRMEHGVLMRHMLHRVHTIPTLFERQSASAPLSRSPTTTAQSPRRSFGLDAGDDECGPGCPTLSDDEDAADVKVLAPEPTRRPSRQSRPCSADVGPWRPAGKDKLGVTAVSAALRSPDRASSRLRSYHRQLPHTHRVEFSGESARGRSHQGQHGADGSASTEGH